MPPQLLQFGLFALEEMIKLEPTLAAELKALFSKGEDPTAQDWQNLRARILTPYSAYDPKPIPGNVVQIPATVTVNGDKPTTVPLQVSTPPAATDSKIPTPAASPTTPQNTPVTSSPASSLSPVSLSSPAAAAAPVQSSAAAVANPPTTSGAAAPAPADKPIDYGLVQHD